MIYTPTAWITNNLSNFLNHWTKKEWKTPFNAICIPEHCRFGVSVTLLYPHMRNHLLLKHILYTEVTISGGTSNLPNILYHDHPDLLSARPPGQIFLALGVTSNWRLLVSFPTDWLPSELSQSFRDVLVMLHHRKKMLVLQNISKFTHFSPTSPL